MTIRDKVILWLGGCGLDEPNTQATLEDKRVAYELEQTPVDPLGLQYALSAKVCHFGVSLFNEPKERLTFLLTMRDN